MNHPIDAEDKKVEDPGPCRRVVCRSGCDPAGGGGATRQSACPSEDSKHLKLLETLIDKIIRRLEDNSCQPKIRDALKAIQLRQKLSEAKSVGAVETSEVERSETHRAENIFWQEIESIRSEVLPKLFLETINLEDQIQRTILDLRHQVKNGILPVKTITDSFNQGRSKQAQLTYHRIGRLLSTMGFRKAKTQTGSSAILWDDRLLQNL